MDGFLWKTLLKWMISGYHHFRKPPIFLGFSFFIFTIPGWFEPLIEKQTRQKVDGFFSPKGSTDLEDKIRRKKGSDFSIHTCRIHLKIQILFSPLYRKLCVLMGFRVSLSRFRDLKRRSGRPLQGVAQWHTFTIFLGRPGIGKEVGRK